MKTIKEFINEAGFKTYSDINTIMYSGKNNIYAICKTSEYCKTFMNDCEVTLSDDKSLSKHDLNKDDIEKITSLKLGEVIDKLSVNGIIAVRLN